MILGIGIDSVEIQRFVHFHTFSKNKLLTIFSEHEIKYCLNNKCNYSERFAVRFAAKEAFYKALCSMHNELKFSLRTVCKNVSVQKTKNGAPALLINWNQLDAHYHNSNILLSLTHTSQIANAIVIIQDKK